MDLVDLLKIAVRRWYVVLPLLLLSVQGALVARSSVELTYESSGSLLLYGPKKWDAAENRLLGFNSLVVPANLVTRIVDHPETRKKLAASGARPDYTIALESDSPAPLIFVTAEGSKEEVPDTIDLVLQEATDELGRRQDGAPPETWITTEIISLSDVPTPVTGNRTRAFLASLAVGLVVTAGLTIAVDVALRRRRRRREAREVVDVPLVCPICDDALGTVPLVDHLRESHVPELAEEPPVEIHTAPTPRIRRVSG